MLQVIWGINADGEYTIHCTDDVLWNCTPETCTILLVSVTPKHSIKGKDPTHSILLELKENLPCKVKLTAVLGQDSDTHIPSLQLPSSRPCQRGH